MKYSSITDVGNVRKINEDDFYVDKKNKRMFIVADGMGGHKAGDVASKMVVNILKNYYFENITENMKIDEIQNVIHEGVKLANKKIIDASKKFDNLNGMGTTLNLAFIHDEEILFVNVGDSRSYILVENELSQITTDHSLVEELLSNGTITESEAQNHPQGNIITSCLGAKANYKIDNYLLPKTDDMKILMCTDGLSNLILKKEMEKIINDNDIYDASRELVNLAKERGGFDNITLIIIEIENKGEIYE